MKGHASLLQWNKPIHICMFKCFIFRLKLWCWIFPGRANADVGSHMFSALMIVCLQNHFIIVQDAVVFVLFFILCTQLLTRFPSFFNPRLTGREPLVFLPGPFSSEAPTGKAHMKQCEQMTLTRRQKRLCRREPGLAETLRESVRLSLLECRYQFRNERWNCSLDGRGGLLKRGETFKRSPYFWILAQGRWESRAVSFI